MTTQAFVTVFGSLHYDILVHSQRSPLKGETLAGTAWMPKCGGKGGNQAISAAKTGMKTYMVGAVAGDDFGKALAANLKAKNVDCSHLRECSDQSTGMSVALFDAEGDYSAVIVSGSNLTLNEHDIAMADDVLTQAKILILQNEVIESANILAAQKAKRANVKTLWNAAPARTVCADLCQYIDLVIVNEVEAEMLSGCAVAESLEGATEAALMLIKLFPEVIVTAGGAGVVYADCQGKLIQMPAEKVKLESTHGAGDEFIGMLASQLAQDHPIEIALHEANKAAAKLVSTPEYLR